MIAEPIASDRQRSGDGVPPADAPWHDERKGRERQQSATVARAEDAEKALPKTAVETWAEESPAYRHPVEYDAVAEDDYWKANHASQPWAGDLDYDHFARAYRLGYQGYAHHGVEGCPFEEAEPSLRREYEQSPQVHPWEVARAAALAAWNRLRERRVDPLPVAP